MKDNNTTQELSQIEKRRLANRLSYQRNKEKRKRAARNYYENNKERCILTTQQYYTKNKDTILQQHKIRYQENKDVLSIKCKKYYQKNKNIVLQKSKNLYQENKDIKSQQSRDYYQRNKEQCIVRAKEWSTKNREKINTWFTDRYHNDIQFKLSVKCRSRIRGALKRANNTHSKRIETLLGCSLNELRTHLEKHWLPGMSWDNYTSHGWHIDHIKPCVSFDLTDKEQQKQCFHYTNLQPLWSKDNCSKGSFYNGKRY